MPSDRVYLSPPDVGDEERTLLLEAFDSNWIAPLGPQVDAFEAEMAARLGVAAGVATSSGTAALHLALHLAGVGPDDEVLVPSLTFVATANAVRYLGGRPLFLDSDPGSWCLSSGGVEEALRTKAARRRRPAAVVAVDLYGNCPDYDALGPLCAAFGVPLVEDAAEALGSSYHDRPAGTFGTCAVLSFNGNKILTTGGGGMLVSASDELVARGRHLASQARQPVAHYQHEDLGYNYRLSNLLAAVGRGQLRSLDDRIALRRLVHRRYRDAFEPVPGVGFMPVAAGTTPNFWLTCILLDQAEFGASPDDVRLALERENIEARPTWKPLHLQPLYRDAEVLGGTVAETVFERGLCLPSGSALSEKDQQRVVEVVLSCRR